MVLTVAIYKQVVRMVFDILLELLYFWSDFNEIKNSNRIALALLPLMGLEKKF
jgi:hypothetical protein